MELAERIHRLDFFSDGRDRLSLIFGGNMPYSAKVAEIVLIKFLFSLIEEQNEGILSFDFD